MVGLYDCLILFRYNPGDVAVIHPEVSSVEVESFLISMGWVNSADIPYQIEHSMLGACLLFSD
jgi:sulfite reductase alpha subunit-like flavoprotein